MLGLLYGCKRQILDPLNPQNNIPQKVQLDKVKGFYQNGRYKNQPKRTSGNGNERMTVQDSARFKDFEPQWDKTEVELLPNNEKMLIVPVVRFLTVDYNKSIGFIRRLCIRVDANEDFLEANIVELVGNLTFVKNNYNAIFKNYKSNSVVSGFDGVIIVRELDYDLQNAKFYSNGAFKENTQTQQEPDPTTQHAYICIIYETVWFPSTCPNIADPDHTFYFCAPGTRAHWETISYIRTCYTDSGGSGSGSGGTGTNSPPPPKPPKTNQPNSPNPPTQNPRPRGAVNSPTDLDELPTDSGVSWNDGVPRDENGNVILPLPNNVVIDASWDLSVYDVKFKCILNKLLRNPIVQAHLHAHYTPANPLRIKLDTISGASSMWTNANFDAINNTITVNSDKYNIFNDAPDVYLATTVFHEIIHSFINGVIKDYAIANPTLNFELNGASSSNPDVVMTHDYYYGPGKNYYIMGNSNQAQHNIMADKYLTTIAQFACSFAGLPPKPNNINALLPLAWKGLSINEPGVQVVTKWANMPESEQENYKDLMKDINKHPFLQNSTSNCR